MKSRLLVTLALAFLTLGFTAATAVRADTLGDSEVVSQAPPFPEGIAVKGNRYYVSGPAAFGQPPGSAVVNSYNLKTGAPEDVYPITIVNPYAGMSGASCIAFGPEGKLYVIEPFVGVIRMSLNKKNDQEVYATFPPSPPGTSLLNDLAFDNNGNLFVTDSFQGAIYRIPKGGGLATLWFADPRLKGDPGLPFGVNGIRFDKHGKNLYVSVTVETGTFAGVIYRLPLVAAPVASDLQEFHRYPATFGPQAPDGIAFGRSGKLYVALAGSSQVSVLEPNGAESARYSGPAANPGGSPNPVPWANPANIAFDPHTGSLLVTNHASLVSYDPSLFVVFDVYVNDKEQPLN